MKHCRQFARVYSDLLPPIDGLHRGPFCSPSQVDSPIFCPVTREHPSVWRISVPADEISGNWSASIIFSSYGRLLIALDQSRFICDLSVDWLARLELVILVEGRTASLRNDDIQLTNVVDNLISLLRMQKLDTSRIGLLLLAVVRADCRVATRC